MEQGNRTYEIARDTLIADVTASKYEQRKLDNVCTRCGKLPPGDESNMCQRCQDLVRKAQARSAKAKRKRLRKAGKCGECGRKSNRYRCLKCRTKLYLSRAEPPMPDHEDRVSVKSSVDHDGDLTRITREFDSADGYGRTRYHGQQQRGRQTIAALDDQDLVNAIKTLIKARRALAIAREPANLALPRVQREDAANEALAFVDHARRFAVDVLARNDYETSEMIDSADDARG